MVRFLSLFSIFVLIFSTPVMAQEEADKVLAEQALTEQGAVLFEIDPDDDVALEAAEMRAADEAKKEIKDIADTANYEDKLKLSRKMHEIWPVRPKVEAALDIVVENIPQQERLKFKSAMRKAIKFEALEEASVEAMVDIFTTKELEAMIAFYGSKEGRSVSHKTRDYEQALQPAVIKMIDKALLDVKLGSQ